MSSLVDAFQCNAASKTTIANDGDNMKVLPGQVRATAIPKAAEIEVEAWATLKAS
jgi:hypothetical protein